MTPDPEQDWFEASDQADSFEELDALREKTKNRKTMNIDENHYHDRAEAKRLGLSLPAYHLLCMIRMNPGGHDDPSL